MTDGDTRLERALKASDPAPRDPMFRIDVMVLRARAVARRRMLAAVGAALGAAIVAAAVLRSIGALAGTGIVSLMAIAAAGIVLIVVLIAPHVGAVPALRGLGMRLSRRLPGLYP